MKNAVITGASGFVGKVLLRELTSHGVEVFAVVRDPKKDIEYIQALPGVHVIQCDMDELAALPGKVNGQADVFFHLAWAGVSGAARADYALQLTNVKWVMDAVNAAHTLGCKRFVGAGTLAQMDVNAYSPLDGATPNPVSCYGVAKNAAHYMSKAECNRLEMDHIWAYLSNTYGEGDTSANFINFAVRTLLSDRPADFTAGEQMYDFVHVEDTAQGLYCLGDSGKANYAYYIGSGSPHKLKYFLKQIRDVVDPEKKLNLGAVPFNGVTLPETVFLDKKLFTDTQYRPRVPFTTGIQRTVDWIKKNNGQGV